MTEFAVNHQALLALAARLDAIEKGFNNIDAIYSYDGDLGSGDLKNEIHDFIGNWSQGRGQISDDIKQCNQYLKGAGTAYKTADEKLAKRFQGGS